MGSSCSLTRKRKCCTLAQKIYERKFVLMIPSFWVSSADLICLIIKSEKSFIGFPTAVNRSLKLGFRFLILQWIIAYRKQRTYFKFLHLHQNCKVCEMIAGAFDILVLFLDHATSLVWPRAPCAMYKKNVTDIQIFWIKIPQQENEYIRSQSYKKVANCKLSIDQWSVVYFLYLLKSTNEQEGFVTFSPWNWKDDG